MDNLKAAGFAAQLSPEEQKRLADYQKSLSVHKELSNLPSDVANAKYQKMTTDQQTNLVKNFGNEDPAVKPHRGWLGTAWHYTGGAVGSALGYTGSHILAGLNNVSDVMTRAYRAGAIAVDQGVGLGDAWTIANDNGDKVFSPGRIADAKVKYGNTAVDVATRIASGEKPEVIMASATPEEKQYIMLADPTNKVIPGINPDDVAAARANFQDTLDAVQAAKYSPGRQIANLVTPGDAEGSGLFYKAVSGAFDAAYRVLADPLLVAGKAKRAYDVSKYALDVVIGGNKVEEVFSKAPVINFWNQYGAKLDQLTKAEAAKSPEQIVIAKKELATLAPELGPSVIKSLQKAPGGGVVDAKTAEAFFQNAKQVDEMMKGQIGRQRVIIPRMDPLRQARIAAVTTGRKVFNIDAVGPKLVDNYWFGGASTTDGIAETIINGQKEIVDKVTAATNFKGIHRFSMDYIQYRIDRAKASFTLAPMFKDDVLDVTAADAPDKIYRLAVMVMPRREAKLLSESFGAIDEVGKKKDVYYGLWSTIADIRGLNTTLPGQSIARYMTGKGQTVHSVSSADDAMSTVGVLPSDFNEFVSAPSLVDLDRAAARNTVAQKLLGVANSDFITKATSAWSFLTLAGPRYAIRNAGEDLMVNLAIGESPWGVAKSRMLSTRLNTVMGGLAKAEGKTGKAENPLGVVLRMVNKKDAERYGAEIKGLEARIAKDKEVIKALKVDLKNAPDEASKAAIQSQIADIAKGIQGGTVQQTREIFARALTEGNLNRLRAKMGLKAINEEEAALLSEQIIYGDINNVLDEVSEGGMNFATGNDYISRATNFARQMGVRTHALDVQYPVDKFLKKPGERGYKRLGVSPQDPASMVAWMMRIGYYSNDKLGSIAVANMVDAADIQGTRAAIQKMTDWINNTPEGAQLMKDARLANQMDARGVATLAYKRAVENFVKEDGTTINLDLLNKIRTLDEKTGEMKVAGKLSLDDLPTNPADIPRTIIGPTLIPAVELNQQTSSVMTNGWKWLGLANARMSRQPIAIAEMVKIRKQMRDTGFEQKWIESYTKTIEPGNTKGLAAATQKAKRDLAAVVEERATNQILAYVDNPLVRTQVAFASRNFARFYRATEDFYRRMYRVVRYNPEGIVKAALTYEGITHSGWVQQDDQGNSYFVYPGLAPVYNAVQNTLERLGIKQEFKVPFPVEFGANVKMLTPSLNPDSLVPTFSGPLAGASITTIASLVNIFDKGAADTIKGYALGKYAVDQPILSAILPAHINRLYAAMNQDDRNSQYASAWRKAVTYLEASGHGLPKKYDPAGNLIPPTPGEMEAYRLAVKNTTLGILGIRFAFGFFAPASPSVNLKSDMAQWISDNGRANFKQTFNKLLDQYPGDYDAAMAKWVELFPNQVPFTITESEKKTLAVVKYSEEAGNFVTQNGELFSKYPSAAGFLIPHKSGFSWDTYKALRDMGISQNKRVDDYLREVQTASDLQQYYAKKNEFEDKMSVSTIDFERTQLRKEFDSWKSVFFAGRPLVQEELSQGSQKAIKRLQTLDELNNMLSKNLGVRPKTEAALREMTNLYQGYRDERDNFEQFGGNQKMIKMLKDETIVKMRELAKYNENTQAAYDVLFGSLLGD